MDSFDEMEYRTIGLELIHTRIIPINGLESE